MDYTGNLITVREKDRVARKMYYQSLSFIKIKKKNISKTFSLFAFNK